MKQGKHLQNKKDLKILDLLKWKVVKEIANKMFQAIKNKAAK